MTLFENVGNELAVGTDPRSCSLGMFSRAPHADVPADFHEDQHAEK